MKKYKIKNEKNKIVSLEKVENFWKECISQEFNFFSQLFYEQ